MQEVPEQEQGVVDEARRERALQTLDAVRSAMRNTDAAIGDLEVDGAFAAHATVSETGEAVEGFAPLQALIDAYAGMESWLEPIEAAIALAAGPVPKPPQALAEEEA